MSVSEPESGDEDKSAFSSSLLLVISRAGAQATNLVLLLVAARILTPAEFGAFSLVSVTIIALVQIADVGWYEYAAKTTDNTELPPELFWCTSLSGVSISLLSALLAVILYFVSGSATYSLLMLIMSVLPMMQAQVALQNGVHTRRNDIIKLPLSVIPAELLGVTIGIYALLNGYHVFSLAMHKIVTVATTLLILLAWGGWFGRLSFKLKAARDIVLFWWQLVLTRVTSYFQNFGSEYLIGALLGLTEVGIFRAAQRFSGALSEIISEPSRFMAWAILPKANEQSNEDSDAFPRSIASVLSMILLFAIPAFIGLAMTSHLAVALLLGEGWEATALVLSFLCFARIISVLIPISTVVMTIDGAEDRLPRLMMILTIISMGALAAIGWIGVEWAAISQLVASLIMVPILIRVNKEHGGLDHKLLYADLLKLSIAAVAMVGSILLSLHLATALTLMPIAEVLIVVGVAALTYSIMILLLRPTPAQLLLNLIR